MPAHGAKTANGTLGIDNSATPPNSFEALATDVMSVLVLHEALGIANGFPMLRSQLPPPGSFDAVDDATDAKPMPTLRERVFGSVERWPASLLLPFSPPQPLP